TLTGGGGIDTFRFTAAHQSGTDSAADTITDFVSGTDELVFTLGGSMTFIGNTAFGSVANEVRFDTGTKTLQIDTNGNGSADIEIKLTGTTNIVAGDITWS
ncbi:MAG: hypothetical protein U1E32_07540, partial [Rhodoglobus sp.]|nr:hypothetical protein [Rhodoglobus sp.]